MFNSRLEIICKMRQSLFDSQCSKTIQKYLTYTELLPYETLINVFDLTKNSSPETKSVVF